MRRSTRIVLRLIWYGFGLIAFIVLMPSLIGSLIVLLLFFAVHDFLGRRRRTTVKVLNSAIRAVCHHDGAIGKVALAFSRSGPLSANCYEYARRLMMGEDALDAAVAARVPLQLNTAIALQSPPLGEENPPAELESQTAALDEMEAMDTDAGAEMPAYGQFLYLTATAMITCLVLAFISAFVVPTLDQIMQEFEIGGPDRVLFSLTPAIAVLLLLATVTMLILPLVNRGHIGGRRLPSWIPTLPRMAERKADLLQGLADGIDAGWSLGRIMTVGHAITVSNRSLEFRSLDRALRLVEQGVEPVDAIRRVGWIDADEAAWLRDAPPPRTAELLRDIAEQELRNARANLRWMMGIFFPLVVLLLGACVLAYAFGFVSALMDLIHALAR